jgi:hypothetical protein
MKSRERTRRPKPERTEPIRSWSTLFETPRASSTGSGSGAGIGSGGQTSLSDVVSRSVDLGYQVIDEYIRQGQKAANRLGERSLSPQTMAADAQEMAARMAQYASGFAALWLEFFQLAASASVAPFAGTNPFAGAAGGAAPRTPPSTPHSGARPDPPLREATRVRVEVAASRPVEVTFDLQPGAAARPLIVHVLRAVDPDKPRITEVSFQPGEAEAPACLRVCVPAGQPPGVYNGLIIDEESSRPVGSLSVSIPADPSPGAGE